MQLSQDQTKLFWKRAMARGISIIMWMPWMWLSLFFTFVLLVTIRVGHLPTYAQPDPKSVGTVSLLYAPTILLFFVTMVTAPVGIMMAINSLRTYATENRISVQAVVYVLGLALFILIVWLDVAGLMIWLLD